MRLTLYFILVLFFNSLPLLAQDSLTINNNIEDAKKIMTTNRYLAKDLLTNALTAAKKNKYYKGEAYATEQLAIVYMLEFGNFSKTDSLLDEALNNFRNYTYEKGVAITLLRQGISNSFQGNHRTALLKYTTAIPYFEKSKDTLRLLKSIRNIGYAYGLFIKDHDLSEYYLKKANTLAELSNNHLQKVEILTGLIGVKTRNNKLEDIPKLLNEIKQALPKLDKQVVKNTYLEGRLNIHYAEFYLLSNDYQLALQYANKAYPQIKGHHYFFPFLIQILATIHRKLENYDLVEDYYRQGMALVKQSNLLELELQLNEEYLKSLKQKNSGYKQHFEIAEQIIDLKNTIANKKKLREIADISKRYEISHRDKELSEQKNTIQEQEIKLLKQKSKAQIISITTIVLTIIILGSYYALNQRKRLIKKHLEVTENQQKLAKAQDIMEGEERERQRIAQNLHDAINKDLTVLKMQVLNIKPLHPSLKQDTVPYINNIISTIRQISNELSTAIFQHNSLVSVLKGYAIDIKKATKKNIVFEVYGEIKDIETLYKTAVFRIVQELITNAIKHSEASEIGIIINSHNAYFDIKVKDNGIGFDVPKVKKGIGLYNIKNRVNLLQADFNLKSNIKGTTAILKVYYDKLNIYTTNLAS